MKGEIKKKKNVTEERENMERESEEKQFRQEKILKRKKMSHSCIWSANFAFNSFCIVNLSKHIKTRNDTGYHTIIGTNSSISCITVKDRLKDRGAEGVGAVMTLHLFQRSV